MKRLIQKYTSILLILPLLLVMAGCDVSSVVAGMNSAADEDMNIPMEDVGAPEPPAPGAVADKNNTADTAKVADEETISLSGKSAVLDIDSEGRMSPFVPYRERNLTYSSLNFGDLPLPPMSGEMDDTLNNLVSAKVTGILYDSKSPSAIINVMDSDYLVKPGDKVDAFQISSITKDYVAIRTGSNVYRAKVGDIVDGEMYGTGVYNLGHRFAGTHHPARKEDVLIVSMKKKTDDGNKDKSEGPKSFNDMSLPPVPEVIPNALPKINLKTQAGEIPLPLGNTQK